MYELILISGFSWFIFRSFSQSKHDADATPQKISSRIGRLWAVAHQGMKNKRYLRAEKALLAILKIDERNAAAYNRLGILYAKQKEYKDAIDCFEIASSIELSPSSLHNLGLIFYETENYEKAATAFEEALKLEDDLAARHIVLAKTLEHLSNNKLMINHLEKATELEPTKESYTLLEKAYRKYGNEDKADIIEDKLKKLSAPKAPKRRLRVRRPKRVSL